MPLASDASSLLLDRDIISNPETLQVWKRTLETDHRERCLFLPGEVPDQVRRDTFFHRIFSGSSLDEGRPLLAALHAEGKLGSTLFVSRHGGRTSWARKLGVPVLDPGEGLNVEKVLAPSLVVKDAISLLLHMKRKREDRPFLTAVNGIRHSGKTRFCEDLSVVLTSLGFDPVHISLRDFTAARKQRRDRSYPPAERYYRKRFDLDRLREQVLLPLQGGTSRSLSYDVFNPDRERHEGKRHLELGSRSILLLDGPFLFQEDVFAFFDYRIYLIADFETSLERELEGLEGRKREKCERAFKDRDLAAQALYLGQEFPWTRAHLTIRDYPSRQVKIENRSRELASPVNES
ncbi:MAG: hypothetical protein QF492_02310 [Candidatus Krumholzibacteria bacterium]|nr:hypothetical protein [Candidatus Krumholzibacteria bacterium]MDP6668729.1 hypothetical protein [Candidatus Krumholzibacteria bacterium]MDP6797219.1 hypothetical protein [Candidatus Krumholzibacteria bacterium]MDP7021190.1 hypothetical protein [Candidatus Krumholzibacteria bacterium]